MPLMLDNGRMQPVVRYAPSVVEKIERWLEENNWPDVIRGDKLAYSVHYAREVA